MAQPRDYHVKSPEAATDLLVISWNVGAAGSVGVFNPTTRRKAFRKTTPVVLVSTGTYDIFLQEKWVDVLWYVANCNGPVNATTGKIGHLVSDLPANATPSVRVTFTRQDTGVAADVASGDQVYVTLAMKKGAPL